MGNLSSAFRLSGQWRHLLRGMERGAVHLSDFTIAHSGDLLAGRDLDEIGEKPNLLMAMILRDFAAAGGKVEVDFLRHLASMFEGGAGLRAEVVRPKGGKPKKYDDLELALDIETRLKSGDKPYIALEQTAKKYGCSKKTAQRAHLAFVETRASSEMDNQQGD